VLTSLDRGWLWSMDDWLRSANTTTGVDGVMTLSSFLVRHADTIVDDAIVALVLNDTGSVGRAASRRDPIFRLGTGESRGAVSGRDRIASWASAAG